MGFTVRSIEQADAEACGKIGFQAHKAISSTHGYPSEQPSIEFAVGMIKTLLVNPNSWGALAERDDKILGSIFLHVFPHSPVSAIGPLTVDPSVEGGVGRALMEAALVMIKYGLFSHQAICAHLRSTLNVVLLCANLSFSFMEIQHPAL